MSKLAQKSLCLVAILAISVPAFAQYQTHVQKNDAKKLAEPRAVSILEWVGDPGKPVASRIVPLSVFINGRYEDGGLYLAQPAPLTVETDTLYELQQAGIPKGNFYVAGGQEIGGSWFGYGKWKPLTPPPPPKKLQPSKTPPRVVQDNDPDRPHMKNSSPDAGSGSAPGGSAGGNSPTPASDPDKPTLHRAPGSGDASQSSSQTPSQTSSTTNSSGSSASANDPDKPTLHRRAGDDTQTASGAGTAPDDPDRPHLRKQSAAAAGASDDGSPVSSVNEGDPDRPKLSRGKPAEAQVKLEPTQLTGVPANLQQIAAISDPASREQHPFAYVWPDPSQATTMEAAMEQLAIKTIQTGGISAANLIGPAAAAPAKPAKTPAAKSSLARKTAPKQPQIELKDKDFRTFELSYNGGATVVFTAKATVPDSTNQPQEKYVTIIAQPDFNGDPQPRLQSVTDAKHLDITPRMKLIDAVDTDGDNRAELIFELMRSSDRQFAIYKIRGLNAEQAFATGSVPYISASHTVETSAN